MTFVKGSTTWTNLASDLTKLACGEIADSFGTTVASGDRWIRDNGSLDCIRSPASLDVNTGTLSMRAGYWALGSTSATAAGYSTFLKQRGVFSAKPSWLTTGHRWAYKVTVNTINSVNGDYSTANIRYAGWDLDSGAFQYSSSSVTPAADGTFTIDGVSLQIGDPSGFLTNGVQFIRHFTPVFLGGIDWWPMYYRRSAAATWGTAPPGTATTDWDFCEHSYAFPLDSSNVGGNFAQLAGNSPGTGLGIKTATGLGANPIYTCSFPMALLKAHMLKSATAGVLTLRAGGRSVTDTVASVDRTVGGHTTSSWMKVFTTPGSVLSSSPVSYWMSVKPNGLMIVVSGDAGATGKTSSAWVGTFAPYDTSYDVLPMAWNNSQADYTGDNSTDTLFDSATQYGYWALRRRLDGTEGSRDWQTKWMRCDLTLASLTVPAASLDWSGTSASVDAAFRAYAWGMSCTNNASASDRTVVPPRQTKPNPVDGKWWFYGVPLADADAWTNPTTTASPGAIDNRFIRGVHNIRWWAMPGDSWANLDELTDSATSNVYLLVAPDYAGIGARWRVAANSFVGGVAIAEV